VNGNPAKRSVSDYKIEAALCNE